MNIQSISSTICCRFAGSTDSAGRFADLVVGLRVRNPNDFSGSFPKHFLFSIRNNVTEIHTYSRQITHVHSVCCARENTREFNHNIWLSPLKRLFEMLWKFSLTSLWSRKSKGSFSWCISGQFFLISSKTSTKFCWSFLWEGAVICESADSWGRNGFMTMTLSLWCRENETDNLFQCFINELVSSRV